MNNIDTVAERLHQALQELGDKLKEPPEYPKQRYVEPSCPKQKETAHPVVFHRPMLETLPKSADTNTLGELWYCRVCAKDFEVFYEG